MIDLLPDVQSVLNGLGPLIHHFAGRTVLLSGARGYLGRFIVATLVEANKSVIPNSPCKIFAMDSLLHGEDRRIDWMNVPNLTFVQHDVCHRLDNWKPEAKFDFVLHLAGIASPFWYSRYPLETIDVTVEGSKTMLELAGRHRARYLYTSSSEVYQTAAVVPTPESYVGAIPSMGDRSCYDVSKLLGETLTSIFAKKFDIHTNVVRIFNSFGVGMAEKDRRILPRIASAIKANRPVIAYDRRGRLPTRTYTPVANTALGLLLVLLKGERNEVYNVGLDSPEVSVVELCSRIQRVTGHEVRCKVEFAPEVYADEPMRRCPEISKLKHLGFLPVVDLDEGLKRYFSWANKVYTGDA